LAACAVYFGLARIAEEQMRFAKYLAVVGVCALLWNPSRGRGQSMLPPMDLAGGSLKSVDSSVMPLSAVSFPGYASDASQASGSVRAGDNKSDLSEDPIYACACGCGVFDVGTSSMLPTTGERGMVWEQYDYQDQVTNWNGHTSVSPAYNPDKKIETSWYTTGFQYFFTENWGIQVEVPIATRFFETTGGASGSDIVHSTWTALGDIRVEALYTGFSADKSIGIDFGLKLPTGNFTHNNAYGDVDRDSEIGTGSTDLLLGGYIRHQIWSRGHIDGFGQVLLDLPFLYSSDTSGSYRPGAELDGAMGVYYTGLRFGKVTVIPIAQVLGSVRRQDSGSAAADPVGSGYQRILLSPGIEVDVHPLMFYADVELPVYQNTSGDQLIGSFLVKGSVSYRF
jgi:hypothetical protein